MLFTSASRFSRRMMTPRLCSELCFTKCVVPVRYVQTTWALQNVAPAKPVIKIPVPVEKRAMKRHKKLQNIARDQDTKFLKSKPLAITCKRKEYNHHVGQTYGTKDKVPLASEGWHHRKSYDDFFTINSFQGIKAQNYTKESSPRPKFSDLDLDPFLVGALNNCGYKSLTNIQSESLPYILENKNLHALVAAETGNGKTLCFLIPVLQSILRIKNTSGLDLNKRPHSSPLGLVVAPSRELSSQIGAVARQLGEQVGIKVEVVTGATNVMRGNHKLNNVDVVVGSFGGLFKLFNSGKISRKFVTEIALDEIDTFMDDTFKNELIPFLKNFGQSFMPLLQGIRIIMTGATFPTNFDNYMSDVIDIEDVSRFSTDQIHKVLFHIPQKFIRSAPSRRLENLMEILEKEAHKTKKKTLIFCNKASTAEFLNHHLQENNYQSISFNHRVHPNQRQHNLQQFARGDVNILTATDLASRGLDTTMVHHVINYDFPLNPADYIHRAGRVGRVGSASGGRVTSLVDGALAIDVLQRIEYAARKNTEILNVNNNIIRIIQHRKNKKELREQTARIQEEEE